MKIENLAEGQKIKNYPELCSILEIKKTSGEAKIKQLNALAEAVQFRQIGHGFIIDKIIKKVELIDKRSLGNNSKHIDNIEHMILDLLSKVNIKQDKKIGFSKNLLYRYCGLTNNNYSKIKGNTLSYSQNEHLPIQVINECFDYTNRKILKLLVSALNRLEKQSILSWRNGYNLILIDENNNEYSEVADLDEVKLILYAENTALNTLGYNDKRMVFLGGKWSSFKKESTEELKKIYPNLKFYYESITFDFKREHIINSISELGEYDVNEIRQKVNSTLSKSLDETIKRKHNKFKNKILFADSNSFEKYAQSEEFIAQQKNIKNILIDINEPDIELDIKYDGEIVKQLRDNFSKKYSCS